MSKGYYIPTYEECERILAETPSNWFIKYKYEIDGYTIVLYNYLLAWYKEFIEPIPNSDIRATELRGLVFILDVNGNVCERYLQLNKFWNVGQVEETQIDVLSKFTVSHIYEKQDGTMISFIRLPNGRVVSKTKASFEHPFLINVDMIVANDTRYQELINDVLDSGCVPFFEYKSIENKVVIDYDGVQLDLIAVRCNNTGVYMDLENYRHYGVSVTNKVEYTSKSFYDFVFDSKKKVGIEGYVIHFTNGYMVKLKTDWYFDLHKIVTDSIYREDIVAALYLNNQLDDVVSKIPTNRKDKLDYIYDIKDIIDYYIQCVYKKVDILILEKYKGDLKEFSILNHKADVFGYAKMKIIDNEVDVYPKIVADLKKKIYFYKNAKMFMDEWREKKNKNIF